MAEIQLNLSRFKPFQNLIPADCRLALDAGVPNNEARKELIQLTDSGNDDFFRCCVSAAWLFQNFLDESHTLSQNIHSPEGSYLHGIMHRREGDYSNAKYWFRRAGEMDFFDRITERIQSDPEIRGESKAYFAQFAPEKLVDSVATSPKNVPDLQRITFWDLFSTFESCFDQIPN